VIVSEVIAGLQKCPQDCAVHITYEGISAEVSKIEIGPLNKRAGDMTPTVFIDAET
jgi:hypothetical protein